MTNIKIAKLQNQDYGAYAFLREQALDKHPDAFLATNKEEEAIRKSRFEANMKHDRDFIMGAFDQEILVGITGFKANDKEKMRHVGFIWGVYVKDEYRSGKIGRQIMQRSVNMAFEEDPELEQINLGVGVHNEPALRLYQSIGFKIFGHEERLLKVGDQYFDEYHMVLRRP